MPTSTDQFGGLVTIATVPSLSVTISVISLFQGFLEHLFQNDKMEKQRDDTGEIQERSGL